MHAADPLAKRSTIIAEYRVSCIAGRFSLKPLGLHFLDLDMFELFYH